jgi:hypothetical protein
MDKARSHRVILIGEVVLMELKSVHKRAVRVTVAWMDNKACWLIDHEEVIVLINDVQRNVLPFHL